jgi:DNA (cytosine-5)-methyltransferase 1
MRPCLLDLCCGAGGAGEGYRRAGFDVVGVDKNPQSHYAGGAFIQADALAFPLEDFDAIHASPPCQLDCAYRRRGSGVGDGYEDLIAPIRERLLASGLPFVIENVEGARHKLRNPIRLCGSSFGLDVRRHRYFESNVPMLAPACDHGWQTPRFPPATNRTNLRSTVEVGVWRIPLETQKRAMGVDWDVTVQELSEMIPPAYAEYIGGYLMREVQVRRAVAV